jgi:hypothetical protein
MTANELIQGQDLRRLLDSDLPDPALVLVEGRVEVVGADERTGLEVVTRAALVHNAGRSEFSDDELTRQAATLSAAVTNLGG